MRSNYKRQYIILVLSLLLVVTFVLGACGPTPTAPPPDNGGSGGASTETPPMPGGIRTSEPTASVQPTADGGAGSAATLAPEVTQPPAGEEPTQDASAGSAPLWAVFFTDPMIPFDEVTTGGMEENLIWLIDHAEVSVDAAVYEFDLQNVADALVRAHQRGVRVRVVHDNEHTEEDPQIGQLIAAGIPVTGDERSAFMHNKFFVFDGDLVWTGSMNITENGVYRNNNNAIAIISPELGANYTTEFEEMFRGEFGPTSPSNTPYPGTQVGDAWVETYFSPEDDVLAQLVSIVGEAQQSVYFMAFSYTHYDLAAAMMERASRGVQVAGLFEARGANTQYSECGTLLNYGIDVRLDSNPRVMHHKVIVIDGTITVMGSFNYSANATESNDENLLIIHSPEIASLYEQEFYTLMAGANLPQGGECLSEQ